MDWELIKLKNSINYGIDLQILHKMYCWQFFLFFLQNGNKFMSPLHFKNVTSTGLSHQKSLKNVP